MSFTSLLLNKFPHYFSFYWFNDNISICKKFLHNTFFLYLFIKNDKNLPDFKLETNILSCFFLGCNLFLEYVWSICFITMQMTESTELTGIIIGRIRPNSSDTSFASHVLWPRVNYHSNALITFAIESETILNVFKLHFNSSLYSPSLYSLSH